MFFMYHYPVFKAKWVNELKSDRRNRKIESKNKELSLLSWSFLDVYMGFEL